MKIFGGGGDFLRGYNDNNVRRRGREREGREGGRERGRLTEMERVR